MKRQMGVKMPYLIMTLHWDLGLEDSKPISRDTLAHDDASPHQVFLLTSQQLRRYGPDENKIKFWTSAVTLTLSTIQQSILFRRQPRLLWCAIKITIGCKRISSSEGLAESHITIIRAFIVTLKTAKQPFSMALWLMMMHRHTKFGDKRFSDLEGLVRLSGQTSIDILKFRCDLDFEQSNFFFTRHFEKKEEVWLQKDQQFKRYSRNGHI